MNFSSYLKSNLSRTMIDDVAFIVFEKPERFNELFELIQSNDEKLAWRSAWACEKIVKSFPEIIDSEKFDMIQDLVLKTNFIGLRRILLSIILSLHLKYQLSSDLINASLEWMNSDKQAIAVQALSLKILVQFALKEPDFKQELIAYIENFETSELSPAMRSSRKNAFKDLSKRNTK